MRSKIILLLFTFIYSLAAYSASCDLWKKLENPALKGNDKFWQEYSELASANKLSEKSLEALLKKHNALGDAVAAETRNVVQSTIRTNIEKKAEREIAKLPTKAMRKNFDEFMDTMTNGAGLKDLYAQPGKWHLEKLKAYPEGNVYTVRINGGYRIKFRHEKNDLSIMEVNASDIHAI